MANTFNFGNGNWAQKTEKLLAYNAENNNYKPLPFDFDRASTATRVNKDGLIETVRIDEPRIDFLNNTKGHLLLEPERTNVQIYSQDFSQSVWNTSSTRSVTFEPTSTIDPEGKTNAYRITSTASDNQVAGLTSILSGTTYTGSIYVKRVSGTGNVLIRDVNNNQNEYSLLPSDGWKRISATAQSNSTNGRLYINLNTVGDSIEIWGAQLEEGSYATSYIPTSGQSGGVTRSAETCSNAGNSTVFNDSEGVLYFEGSALANDGTNRWAVSLSDGSNDERVQIIYLSDNSISSSVISSNSSQCSFNYSGGLATDFNKIAISYKDNDFKMYVNGTQVDSDTSGNAPSGLNTLGFERPTGVSQFYGNIKDVRVYNTALSDSELQALTS